LASATPVERWIFLLRHAQNYDVVQLRRLFPEVAFQQAIQSIQTIALKTEDKQMYDTREKAARDHLWLMNGAREEAREEGREEGFEKGSMIGTIGTLQAVLGLAESNIDDLRSKSIDELKALALQLQSSLRGRMA